MRSQTSPDLRVPGIRASFLIREMDAAGVVDVPARELCRAVGMDVDRLEDPATLVSLRQLAQVYDEAARRSGDDALGLHVGEHSGRSGPGRVDVVDYAFISRPNLAKAFEDVQPLVASLYPEARLTLAVDGDAAVFGYQLEADDADAHRHRCESLLTGIMKLAQEAVGTEAPVIAASFQHAKPADVSEHARIFRAPVEFGWPVSRLVFSARWLRAPLRTADANLSAVLDRHLHDLIARIPVDRTFSSDVRRELDHAFLHPHAGARVREGGIARDGSIMARLARKLGVSERTLQRRLHDEGTTLQELVDRARAELSLSFLRDPGLSLPEIADRLGYTSPGAFSRAFRRWQGVTPAAYRRPLKGGR